MSPSTLPAEVIAAIVFGLLQLAIGLLSLWQQHQLRQAYRKHSCDFEIVWELTMLKSKGMCGDGTQSDGIAKALARDSKCAWLSDEAEVCGPID
jgi:hypothetical protein